MPLDITFAEEFHPDDALLVQDERRRMRNPLGATFGFSVPNSEGVNRPAAFVGKQRERNLMPGLDALEHFDRVVADADDLYASRFDVLEVGLQLN